YTHPKTIQSRMGINWGSVNENIRDDIHRLRRDIDGLHSSYSDWFYGGQKHYEPTYITYRKVAIKCRSLVPGIDFGYSFCRCCWTERICRGARHCHSFHWDVRETIFRSN